MTFTVHVQHSGYVLYLKTLSSCVIKCLQASRKEHLSLYKVPKGSIRKIKKKSPFKQFTERTGSPKYIQKYEADMEMMLPQH